MNTKYLFNKKFLVSSFFIIICGCLSSFPDKDCVSYWTFKIAENDLLIYTLFTIPYLKNIYMNTTSVFFYLRDVKGAAF